MKKIILTVLMAAALSTASANPETEATFARASGDYAAQLKITRPLAEAGVAWAQSSLGNSFLEGRGEVQNYAEAAKWYRLAAAQGVANAQFYLGMLYQYGNGVVKNYAEAAKWYRLAAEQGDPVAQYSLGLLLRNGQGVVQDFKKAYMWLDLAAYRGFMFQSLKARQNVEKQMTLDQINEALSMVNQCLDRNFKGCD